MTTQKKLSISSFGQDHESLLLYIETRCVDHSGVVDKRHMRCNGERHPAFSHSGGWDDKHSTRLKKGTAFAGHDDWDCVGDLENAQLIETHPRGPHLVGAGAEPIFKLTSAGWKYVGKLRRARAERLLKG